MTNRFLPLSLEIDAVTVFKACDCYASVSGESSSTGAQSASAGLQPTTTVGTGAAGKAKQGMYDQECILYNEAIKLYLVHRFVLVLFAQHQVCCKETKTN